MSDDKKTVIRRTEQRRVVWLRRASGALVVILLVVTARAFAILPGADSDESVAILSQTLLMAGIAGVIAMAMIVAALVLGNDVAVTVQALEARLKYDNPGRLIERAPGPHGMDELVIRTGVYVYEDADGIELAVRQSDPSKIEVID